jgi:hypothetical protein
VEWLIVVAATYVQEFAPYSLADSLYCHNHLHGCVVLVFMLLYEVQSFKELG